MSGIGHLAAGFVAKPAAPKVPLWVLLAAAETNDLLYLLFTAVGIEAKASLTMDFHQGVRYLSATTNPCSHGLFMSVVWSIFAALIAQLFYLNRRTASVIGGVVFSHWVLDFLMHSNLPLFFGNSPLLGLGLENSGPGFILLTILDLALVGGGVAIYLISRLSKIRHQERLSGNFRGRYPDLGVRACVRTLSPPNLVLFTAKSGEPQERRSIK